MNPKTNTVNVSDKCLNIKSIVHKIILLLPYSVFINYVIPFSLLVPYINKLKKHIA
jgi:hypothetical protein